MGLFAHTAKGGESRPVSWEVPQSLTQHTCPASGVQEQLERWRGLHLPSCQPTDTNGGFQGSEAKNHHLSRKETSRENGGEGLRFPRGLVKRRLPNRATRAQGNLFHGLAGPHSQGKAHICHVGPLTCPQWLW